MAPGRQPLRRRAAGHRLLRGERSVRLGGPDTAGDLSACGRCRTPMRSPSSASRTTRPPTYPVLPVVKGISVAKLHITLYILAFMVPTLMLFLGGYAGYKYLVVATAVSVWWLGMALSGYKAAVGASCSCSPSLPLPARNDVGGSSRTQRRYFSMESPSSSSSSPA